MLLCWCVVLCFVRLCGLLARALVRLCCVGVRVLCLVLRACLFCLIASLFVCFDMPDLPYVGLVVGLWCVLACLFALY